MKEIIDKYDFIKIKNCSAKDNVVKMKEKGTGRKYAKDVSDKGLLPTIHKEFIKFNN